jgi:hypothetical protein
MKRAVGNVPHGIERLLVRYEDLVADVHGQADRLGTWLGVQLDGLVIEGQRGNSRHHMTAPSVAASVGRWRTDLSAAESRYISRELGSYMDQLGYAS